MAFPFSVCVGVGTWYVCGHRDRRPSRAPKSRAQPPSSGDCDQVLAQLPSKKGSRGRFTGSSTCCTEDAQLAPSEPSLIKSADGRMAAEGDEFPGRPLDDQRQLQNLLDSDRPSHGRTWLQSCQRIPLSPHGGSCESAVQFASLVVFQ